MRYWKFNRGGSSSYLMHHGIDGQRWGVRHGPPYPLDRSVSTGKKLKDTGSKRESIIGPLVLFSVWASELGFIAGTKAYQKHRLNTYNDRNDEFKRKYKKSIEPELGKDAKKIANGDKETINKYKKEGNPKTMSKADLKAINSYGMENPYAKNQNKVDNSLVLKDLGNGWFSRMPMREAFGRSRNCPNCATAFNLNKLGWKFKAAPVEDHGRTGEQITKENKKMFKGITISDIESRNDFKRILNEKPDGSFGSFGFIYRGSGGHILNWAVENGTPKIYDAQNGTRMSVGTFLRCYDPSFGNTNEFYDLSNVTSINWDKVSEYKYTY